MSLPNEIFQNDKNALPAIAVDLSAKFIRLLEINAKGLVSFEFSIGWPDLLVELLLPRAAFFEFCQVQNISDIRFANDDVQKDWLALAQYIN